MVNYDYNFIFVHVPKTGGRSVEAALSTKKIGGHQDPNFPYGKHSPHHPIKTYFSRVKGFNSMFKFAFVRNPFSRILSEYLYVRRWEGCLCKENFNFKEKYNTFKKFIRFGAIDVCSWENHNTLQIEMADPDYMDFIGRFENLQEDFNTICDKIGAPRKMLPHRNKTKHKHYTEYYDDETRKIIEEKYAKDIEYFGYKFAE